MLSFLKDKFTYNYHFNNLFISKVESLSSQINPDAVKLVNHILNAQSIWLNRIEQKSQNTGVWQLHTFDELHAINKDTYQTVLRLTESLNPETIINYTTSTGEPFSGSVGDILYHILNHGTYHRAQINSMLKQAGAETIPNDYIIYKRTYEKNG